jgi:membrane associated rhomboid family serine protease
MPDGAFFSQSGVWLGNPTTYGTARRLVSSQTFANHQAVKKVLWGLIGINAAVWGTWNYAIVNKDQKLLSAMNENFLLSEANLKEGRYHTLVTSAFSHISFSHFLFNMVGSLAETESLQGNN